MRHLGMCLAAACLLLAAAPARAQDWLDPGRFPRPPRFRLCCAFGSGARVDVGAGHAPILIDMVGSAEALGHHSYLGFAKLHENNGLVYTCRGGFVDLSHVRDTGDWTAYLATRLRERLGTDAVIPVPAPAGPPRTLRLLARTVPVLPEARDALAVALAQRIAYELMLWLEIEQLAGLIDVAGISEKPSGLSPDDPYSNLLGVFVAARALRAPGRYEDNFDRELARALHELGAQDPAVTREAFDRVNGRWWDRGRAWPNAFLTLRRVEDVGPTLEPWLLDPAPPECSAPPPPEVLSVPERDESGAVLSAYYTLAVEPDLSAALGTKAAAGFAQVSPAEFHEVASALQAQEKRERARDPGQCGLDDPDCDAAVAHYVMGLRLFVLEAFGGAQRDGEWDGVFGGRLLGIDAQTRGGDLQVLAADIGHDRGPRGLVTRLALAHTDALYFCREPGRGTLHPPFLGWLRSCEGGGVVMFGGDVGEVLHDGDTGRTIVRPLTLRVGVNPLANGFEPSYDRLRLLGWIGGGFDNAWTQADGGELSPRAQLGLRFLLRSADLRWELDLRGLGNVDPAERSDRGVETALTLAHHVLLGGGAVDDDVDEAPSALHRTVPWAVLRIAVESSYARFDEPENALPTVAGLFVSDRDPDTVQLLLRVGITPSAMTF